VDGGGSVWCVNREPGGGKVSGTASQARKGEKSRSLNTEGPKILSGRVGKRTPPPPHSEQKKARRTKLSGGSPIPKGVVAEGEDEYYSSPKEKDRLGTY